MCECDPQFSVDNRPGWNFAKNDVYCAALRDVIAGFNFGFVGSPVTNPHTGKPFGKSSTDTWVNTKSDYAYSGAQPNNPTFYNQYANVIARASDSYGFPFGDTFVHRPLMNLRNGKLLCRLGQGLAAAPMCKQSYSGGFHLGRSQTSHRLDRLCTACFHF